MNYMANNHINLIPRKTCSSMMEPVESRLLGPMATDLRATALLEALCPAVQIMLRREVAGRLRVHIGRRDPKRETDRASLNPKNSTFLSPRHESGPNPARGATVIPR